jgi:hypothetical protein
VGPKTSNAIRIRYRYPFALYDGLVSVEDYQRLLEENSSDKLHDPKGRNKESENVQKEH